jgi:tetratricopeptide (TPR) repeat protein
MPIDPINPVVLLCAAGMERDGEPEEARRLFQQAWDARRNDYDAAIAAHYLARHQPTPDETLRWNSLAVTHAERVVDGRTTELFPSLYLNLASSLAALGRLDEARIIIVRAKAHLETLRADGYREFLAYGISRLQARIGEPT